MNAQKTQPEPHFDPASGAWHVDKRIPAALIITILLQSALAVWWASAIDNRVTSQAAEIIRHETRITAVEAVQGTQAVNTAVLSQQLVAVRESLAEIKSSQAETNRLLRDQVESNP